MHNPPFNSDIFYSVQNEDYRTELAVLDRDSNRNSRRILIIASSGENVLSLLTRPDIELIDAIDMSPAQIQLCELRRTALHQLERDDQLRLLGADPARFGKAGEAERLALYESLRMALPETSRAYWDDRRDRDIAFGVHHVGRNDILMHDLVARLQFAGFEPLSRPLQEGDLPAWKSAYAAQMTVSYFMENFGMPNQAIAEKLAGMAPYVAECHFRALRQPGAERNPYLTTVFASAYAGAAGEDGLPLYLQEVGQTALKRLGTDARLKLAVGNFVEQMPILAQQHGPYDLISISNIAEWMTDTQLDGFISQGKACLRPGGVFLARTANPESPLLEVMGRHLAMDSAFNAHLAEVERGPWFRIIGAGYHQ